MLRVYGQKPFVEIVNSATTLPSTRQKKQNIETSVKNGWDRSNTDVPPQRKTSKRKSFETSNNQPLCARNMQCRQLSVMRRQLKQTCILSQAF